jgi:hypothetical protein
MTRSKRPVLPADFGDKFDGLPCDPLFDLPPAATGSTDETKTHRKPAKTAPTRPGVTVMSNRTGAPVSAPAVELGEQAAAQRARYLQLVQEISAEEARLKLQLAPRREELAAIEAWFAERVPVGSEGTNDGATLARWKTPRREFSVTVAAMLVPAAVREKAQVVSYDRQALEKALTADQREVCMVPGNGQPKVEIL